VVLTACTEYWSNKGGVPSANRDLTEAFGAAGADAYGLVSVVDPGRPGLMHAEPAERVRVLGAEPVWGVLDRKGAPDTRALFMLPEGVPAHVDAVVGHSRFSGGGAKWLAEHVFPDAKYVQVLHTSPEVLDALKGDAEGLVHAQTERELMAGADVVAGVGPLLGAEARRLAGEGTATGRTPPPAHTIIPDLPAREGNPPPRPADRVGYELLIQGRADDVIKGVKLGARLAAELATPDAPVRLVVRGAPEGTAERQRAGLYAVLDPAQARNLTIDVREYSTNKDELLQDLYDADLVLMPSVHEGFGLVATDAVRAGKPILVGEGAGAGRFFGDPQHVPAELGERLVVRDGNTVEALREALPAVTRADGSIDPVALQRVRQHIDDTRLEHWVQRAREVLAQPDPAGVLRTRDYLAAHHPPGSAARGLLDALGLERPGAEREKAVAERPVAETGRVGLEVSPDGRAGRSTISGQTAITSILRGEERPPAWEGEQQVGDAQRRAPTDPAASAELGAGTDVAPDSPAHAEQRSDRQVEVLQVPGERDRSFVEGSERLRREHPEVADLLDRLMTDRHLLNLTADLRDPARRDRVMQLILEMAHGRILDSRPLEIFLRAHPGDGPLFASIPPEVNHTADGVSRKQSFIDSSKELDPARRVGAEPATDERALVADYARRLVEETHPLALKDIAELSDGLVDARTSARSKTAEALMDKVARMAGGSSGRAPRPGYSIGDVVDGVGARITVRDTAALEEVYVRAVTRLGVGDGGRILEIENMYLSPKGHAPRYRLITLIVEAEGLSGRYTYELQLTTHRASVAADFEHNVLYKPHVGATLEETRRVRDMMAEAAAADQAETRHRSGLSRGSPAEGETGESGPSEYLSAELPAEGAPGSGDGAPATGLIGAARELAVARLVGGHVLGPPGEPGMKVSQPGAGTTDVDVMGAGGEYIAVGGPGKARNPAKLGQKLSILKYAAGEAGAVAQAFFEEGTPDSALQLARRILGEDNVFVFRRDM
jgi:hypothetical protein